MKKIPSILLIDDDTTTNYINKITITKANLSGELIIAVNGKEALQRIQENSTSSRFPNLIFLDINMPVLDGFGFLKELQELEGYKQQDVIIVILSTSLDPRDIARVRRFGVNEFINKPLTKASLNTILDKYF